MSTRGPFNPYELVQSGLISGVAFAVQAGARKAGLKRGALVADFVLEVGKDIAGLVQGKVEAKEIPLRAAKSAARTAASWGLARVGAKAGFVIAGPAGALVGSVAGSALATFVSKNYLL